ncbi:MAG: cysteine synthase A [Thermodesulfobacteriota bacterium]
MTSSTLASQLRRSESLTDLIGKTPLLRLQSFESSDGAAIWGKLESANPGGSVKDRIALGMIRTAEKDGLLQPGATLVEPTSGNTGIGLAWICAQLGYKLILCMPESMSMERRQLLQAHGARLELTPKGEGMTGAIARAEQLQAETSAFMPQQFNNPANPAAHAATTGPEIYTALEGKVDAFVTGVGTGGTITGVGLYLRSRKPEVHLAAVEPEASAVLSGGSPAPHAIQGIGAGFVPAVLEQSLLDEVITISDEQAQSSCVALNRAGISAGISAGANVAAAQQVAAGLGAEANVVTTLCDGVERYLSTNLFV